MGSRRIAAGKAAERLAKEAEEQRIATEKAAEEERLAKEAKGSVNAVDGYGHMAQKKLGR